MNRTGQYLLVEDGQITEGPAVMHGSWRNTTNLECYSDAELAQMGWLPQYEDRPALASGEKYGDQAHSVQADRVVTTWDVVPMTADDLAEIAARVQGEVITATQARLDAFAGTRNYDGILSACTYATSTVPKFASEGQYCVEARDQTWATLYQIMGAVESGTRPMPSGYAEIEPELPTLVWPR